MKLTSIKIQLSLFLGVTALCLSFIDRDIAFLIGIIIATFFSVFTDSAINFIKNKKLTVTESSVVSGLIIGCVISSDASWYIIALTGIFAITFKHIIRFKGKHLFNPAALGIVLSVFLLNVFTQWKAAYLWYVIVPFGLYFVWRTGKLQIVFSYFIVSLLLYGLQAAIKDTSFSNVFWYFNYFFIFIMMIEPKTSPVTRKGKIIFGSGLALSIFILYEIGGILETELLSLLAFNILTPLLNKIK